MPVQKRTSTTSGSRKTTKKTKSSTLSNHKNRVPRSIVNSGAGFPNKMVMTLNYKDTLYANSVSGSVNHHVFSLNGLYDPNITLTGHQPLYFTKMMAIYNHYSVMSSKIVIRAQTLAANGCPMHICLWQNDDNTVTPSTMNALREQPKSNYGMSQYGAGHATTLSMKWNYKDTFGKAPLSDIYNRGNVSINPPEQSFAVVSVAAVDTLSTVAWITVDIEYTATFYELKDVAS